MAAAMISGSSIVPKRPSAVSHPERAPGTIEGTHRHIGTEELYYIVEGAGIAYLGENDDPSLAHLPTVEVVHRSGLVVDVAAELGVDFIVKGLRTAGDFEIEMQMAQMNQRISGVDTLFIPSASEHSFLASKLIREVARFGGDVSSMVPEPVAKRLAERFGA